MSVDPGDFFPWFTRYEPGMPVLALLPTAYAQVEILHGDGSSSIVDPRRVSHEPSWRPYRGQVPMAPAAPAQTIAAQGIASEAQVGSAE